MLTIWEIRLKRSLVSDTEPQSPSHLASNPFLGVIPKDERLKKLGYRMLIVDKYLVFFVVKTKTVQIRRIIHGARRYGFLLQKSHISGVVSYT